MQISKKKGARAAFRQEIIDTKKKGQHVSSLKSKMKLNSPHYEWFSRVKAKSKLDPAVNQCTVPKKILLASGFPMKL